MATNLHSCRTAEKEALLGMTDDACSSSSSLTLRSEDHRLYLRWRNKRLILFSLLAHGILALCSLGGVVLMINLRGMSCLHGPDLIYSPAREAVFYETRFMNNSLEEQNAFKGLEPSREQTEAWADLLSWQILVLTEDDMVALDRLSPTSVKFEDGSGYLGQLDVYHELHCLNYIREYMHRSYYNVSIETPATQIVHVDHCIDTLRQIIMCHADTSIVTYNWVEGHETPIPNFAVERECRNWDRIFDFVQVKQPHMHEGMIVNPNTGSKNVSLHGHGAGSHLMFR